MAKSNSGDNLNATTGTNPNNDPSNDLINEAGKIPVVKTPEQLQEEIDGSEPDLNHGISKAISESEMNPKSTQPSANNPAPPVKPLIPPVPTTDVTVSKAEWDDYQQYKKEKAAAAEAKAKEVPKPEVDPQTKTDQLRLKRFGPGYIVATNKRKETSVFTKQSWDVLGGDDNSDGWKREVKIPAEVKALQNK